MKLTLIAPTYKRPDICNRLIKSVPSHINILIVNLGNSDGIIKKDNVTVVPAEQMPLCDALNLGVKLANIHYPETEAYILTDDDVYFIKETVLEDNIFDLLKKKDTGLVAITRVINGIKLENKHIVSHHVYKGGGYIIKKEVFEDIGGYESQNSVDEWDICIKTYIKGYVNYRTKSAYAFHKQGTNTGGYKRAIADGINIGKASEFLKKYVDAEIVTGAGYEYFSGMKTKFNTLAKSLHRLNNIKINNDKSN